MYPQTSDYHLQLMVTVSQQSHSGNIAVRLPVGPTTSTFATICLFYAVLGGHTLRVFARAILDTAAVQPYVYPRKDTLVN